MRNLFQITTSIRMPLLRKLPRETLGIKTDVVLGSPSARCNGVGICRVMGYQQSGYCPCPVITATLSLGTDKQLRFSFEKAGMTDDYKVRHFGWHLFTVYERYRLSPRLCKQLGWQGSWIEPGVYNVWETADSFVVEFTNTAQSALV